MRFPIALAAFAAFALACSPKADPAPATAAPPSAPAPSAHDDHAAHQAHGHHATGTWTCPMHPDVRAAAAGRCPQCGMDLVAANPAAAKKTFDVTVTAAPQAGQPSTLTFKVVDELKQPVKDFDVVHEKKLHLLMASRDLSWFGHEHPDLQPDGSFTLPFTFPAGGPYLLYSDFRPSGAHGQVIQKPITVGGAALAPKPLAVDDLGKAKTVAGHQVRLQASSLAAGDQVRLDFLIVKDGKPVTDLVPYLGAQGHCVILSADGSEFLHSHPDDVGAHDHTAGTAAHAHPKTPGQVTFATQFPKAGRYKIWGQFLHGSEMIIADFVVDVTAATGKAGAAPAAAHGHEH